MATSIGARLRVELDRDSEEFKTIYKQRTATERINSQATEIGIERPRLRNYMKAVGWGMDTASQFHRGNP